MLLIEGIFYTSLEILLKTSKFIENSVLQMLLKFKKKLNLNF